MKDKLPHIVIVGGGAGGIELAVQLGKTLGKKNLAEISLVDKNLTHVWKPLLHEVAAGTINSHEDELDYFLLSRQHHFDFEYGTLIELNRKNKTITLKADEVGDGDNALTKNLQYDVLILAVGSITNDFNTPGARENCYFLDDSRQAEMLHHDFLNYFIKSQYQNSIELQIAIVGGGATGVELAAELHYAINNFSQYDVHSHKKAQKIEITLIEAGARLLSNLPLDLSNQVQSELQRHKVKILLDEKVSRIDEKGIHTQSGKYISAHLKIWAAGVKCHDYLNQLDGLATNKLNQLLVKSTLQTTVDDSIFAMGDCAACPQPNSDKPVPPRAQSAHQEADFLAKSLKRWIKGSELLDFSYRDFGSLVTLSKHTAIGHLMAHKGINIGLSGRIARWTYVALYKRHQVAILGWWRTALLTIANFFMRPAKARLKLH